MRRVSFALLSLCVMTSLTPGVALADSLHFIHTSNVGGVFDDGGISVSFKEAGLGDNQTMTYSLRGAFLAHYGCINNGGNHPQATNKETVKGDVIADATFTYDKYGNIVGTIPFAPPDPDSVLDCPGIQVAVLADIQYTSLTLQDATGTFATLSKT